MAERFHNPYHFVPVDCLPEKHKARERRIALADKDGLDRFPHVTHARYVEGTHSGTITCRITTLTPLIVGGEQKGKDPKTVEPYRLPGTQEVAIPGSSLRGMISSIVETATASAMRVLDAERRFSYRKIMDQGLSALGMIVEWKGGVHLFPLAGPHLESNNQTMTNPIPLPKGKESGSYASMFKTPTRKKVYLGDKQSIRDYDFLKKHHSYQPGMAERIYALPINQGASKKIKPPTGNGPQLWLDLGLETSAKNLDTWDDAKHNDTTHIRGILRVLGVHPSRESGMKARKHEFFIKFSESDEENIKNGSGLFPITPVALARFNALADERTEETKEDGEHDILPYTPHGQHRGIPGKGRPKGAYALKTGDIVFFRPSEDGAKVVEISLSSIWRKRMEGADGEPTTLADLVAEIDPALLPAGHKLKTHLTPAELMFGFVEERTKLKDEPPNRALASRIRVGTAKPFEWEENGEQYIKGLDPVDLKILDSPKPNSPRFYFRSLDGTKSLGKNDLMQPGARPLIQGRKGYLHHPAALEGRQETWRMHQARVTEVDPKNPKRGKYDKQRLRARLLPSGKSFEFKVHFDNLDDFELGALLYALRPAPAFRHKLGLGKPLGLGSILLDPHQLELVNRQKRYQEDQLLDARYHQAWICVNGNWRAEEKETPTRALAAFREACDSTACKALELLGDPTQVNAPVHYPQVLGPKFEEPAFENEHFKWFVANEGKKGGAYFLKPLSRSNGASLEPLNRLWLGPMECAQMAPDSYKALKGPEKGKVGKQVQGPTPQGKVTNGKTICRLYYRVTSEGIEFSSTQD